MNKLQSLRNLLLVLMLLISPIYSQSNSEAQIRDAYELLKSEKFEPAVFAFSNVLRSQPDSVQARLGLAIALTGVDKFSEASREIAKLLARSPNDAKLLEFAARTLWQQKRSAETENVLKRLLALDAKRADLWALYGDVLDAQKKTIEAVTAYEKAVDLNPESIDYRYALGSLFWKRIRYHDAEREFLEILRRKPNEPRASFNLGDIYLTKGEAARAVPYLETAVKSFAVEFDTRLALGRAYLAINKYDLAIEHLQIAVKLRPEISEGYYQLGLALQKTGRREEAKRAFKTTRELQKAKLDSEIAPAAPKSN